MQLATEIQEYERLAAEYRAQEARGIPMSVREWYERKLAELRAELRGSQHRRPLGEILVEKGWADESTIQLALQRQIAG